MQNIVKKLAAAGLVTLMAVSAAGAAEKAEFRTVYSLELPTLNYLTSSNAAVIDLSQLVEDGLVEFDRYGLIMPSLAESWEISEDRRTYTFHIRRGVNWYTCEGEEYAPVTAHDFEAGMKWQLNKKNASGTANTVYANIAGARDYFEGRNTDWNSVGVKVTDDYTVQYTFINPVPYALKLFAYNSYYPVCQKFLDEVGQDFGTSNDNLLYCGAYIMSEHEPEYQRVLNANPHYWNSDAAHIKRIVYKYNKEASANGPALFERGEVMEVSLPGTIMDEWMNDPEKKKLIHPDVLTTVTYFMGFNFEPKYSEEYAPKDWAEAVNNLNFRKALFHGVDRTAALLPLAPYDAQRRLVGTLTPPSIIQYHGVDYTQMNGLKAYTEGESFNPELALEYKKKAMEELKGKVKFPVSVIMTYKSDVVDDVNQAQVMQQQLEKLLGTDFIRVVIEPYPSTGYIGASRNSGKYSFSVLRWGPDYVDPLSVFDPMMTTALASRYTRINMARGYFLPDGRPEFEAMAEDAAKECLDLQKRYEMFAKAETFLLDNAFVVPLYLHGGGYIASYVDPFSGYTTQWGDHNRRKLKGAKLLDRPMGMEEFAAAEKKYLKERDEARRNAKYE